jgi:cold shock CspA family protein
MRVGRLPRSVGSLIVVAAPGRGPGAYIITDGARWVPDAPTASPPVVWDDGGVTSLFEEMREAREARPKTAPAAEPTWVEGTIKRFIVERKQGFARPAGGYDNVLFARAAVEGCVDDQELVHGRRVRLVVEEDGRGGLKATRLQLLD